MKRCCTLALCVIAWASLLSAQRALLPGPGTDIQPPSPSADGKDAKDGAPGIDLLWAFKIPMRDGVHLNATVFKPTGQKDPLPVIFTLTPYISDTYQERASYFSRHGYVFALVDERGRGNSEGSFDPFAHDAQDGYDIVEYLARQPWADGKVAMWGGSYAGFDQWAAASQLPAHLATIVPVAAARPGVDFPVSKGFWVSYDMQWLTMTSSATGNSNLFGESAFWTQKFRAMYTGQRPYETLDQITGNTSTVFSKWMQHPVYDSFWQAMSPSSEQYAKINVPILSITADYDGDQMGALSYYRDHMKYGSAESKARHYLIIGPWDHAGTRTPNKNVGGLTFGDASMLDMNDLHRQWYDWTLKNGPKPEFLKKRVAYYVIGPGAENWKYADDLDAIATAHRKLYIGSQAGSANDVFRSGELSDQPASSQPDKFTYDPADLRPGELEKDEIADFNTDQRFALNLYGNGVVYHSDPFPEATEISGNVLLSVWMAIDVPDTDFSATLYEILPNGQSVQLTSDNVRARYRISERDPALVKPGEINRYDFDAFTWFSRRISKGSRLRLLLSCVNSTNVEKNYNSGGAVEKESGKDARVAHVTVYHDAGHPSALEIPVVQ